MTIDATQLVTIIVTFLASGGLATAIVSYMKDRKKDNATAKLTDVEALQKQLVLLTSVTDFVRKENAQLQLDYEALQNRYSAQRARLAELEEELQRVKRSAASTQEQCEELSAKLRSMMGEGDDMGRGNRR